jgi:hypothetical protein
METFPQLTTKHYREIHSEIRSGDILLCSGNTVFSNLIKKATRSIWSHVAFILRLDIIDRVIVLESVESIGVRAVPLSHYVCNYNASGTGYEGKLMLARHQDVSDTKVMTLSTLAVDYLGYPYGKEEIIHIAARLCLSNLGYQALASDAVKTKAFICSEYAQLCFNSIGIHIDYNRLGYISPDDFANHPKIYPLYFLNTENENATCAPLYGRRSADVNN